MAKLSNLPALMTFGKAFSRSGAFPLDMYEIWTDKEALIEYAKTDDTAYAGQKVTFIDAENSKVIYYGIEIDGSLKELGADKLHIDALTEADVNKIPQAYKVVTKPASNEEPEEYYIDIRWVDPTDYAVKVTTTGVEDSIFKHYIFTQCGSEIAHIDIPKDLVVQSGKVEVKDASGVWGDAGTYIVLTIANQEEPIYINTTDLVDIYTVADTNTIDMTINGTEIKADVKISSETGNSLVKKNDGLYVNAPTPPSISVEDKTADTVPTTDTVQVVSSLAADGHKISPKVVDVVTKKAWDTLGATGERLINDEEINKLSALVLGEGGGVEISGTVNAKNVHGLGAEVIDLVTGNGSYVSTPAVGTEGDPNYVPATIVEKLGIEKGAQANKIETIGLPDAMLTITNKGVSIPAFTNGNYGVIKGAVDTDGKPTVNALYANNGVGEVKAISTDILVNGKETLILYGGDAEGI